MKLIHKQQIINPVLIYQSGGKTKGITRTVGPKGSEMTYHVNPQDYGDFLKGNRNVTLPETTVTAADPKNYRSDFHPEDIGTFMNVATAGFLNRGSLSQDLHLLKDTYDAATGNKSWKDVANSAILGNSGVFKNPWANLALDVVVPTTGVGIYKLASLKNTAKNAVKNSTLVDDVTAVKNYEKLGAKPVTINEADKLHYPDYIMPLYKIRQPKEVKEFYPEMLRRIKDNFNVDSKDLTESFSKQSETPIYIGKYDDPRYSGTHMMDTGESYVNLNNPNPISTAFHEAARHGTENTLQKYVPKAWKGYTDFIDTLRPYMGHLITEGSKDPAELRSTLGEVYLQVHKLVKQAYKNHASELPAEFGNESINQYERFGDITNHNINDILTDDDILRMLEQTNAYGQDYTNVLKAIKKYPSIYRGEFQDNQKIINQLQQQLKQPNISREEVKKISDRIQLKQQYLDFLSDRLRDSEQEYPKAMAKLRELLTKYPMFTGTVAVGTGYGMAKHKNGGTMKIHIKKKNEGKFTSYCGGKVTQDCIDRAKASGNSKLVKRAVFAENVRHWKHQNGGILKGSMGMEAPIDPPDDSFVQLAQKSGSGKAAAPILKKIYYDVKKQGATEQQAAAATITAAFESHGNYKAKHGQFKGLGQWDASRYPGNYSAQIKELTGKDKSQWVRDGYNTFMHTQSTPADTTRVYTKDFIRGGNPTTRAKIAQKLFGMTNNY